MRRLFSLAFVALFSLVVSCEQMKPQDPQPKQPLTLTSESVVDFSAAGGVGAINYTLEGEGSVVATTDNSQMFDAINTNTKGVVRFSVNENVTTDIREANIIVSYGDYCFTVHIIQAAAEVPGVTVVEVKANQLVGNYYGEDVCPGVGHYWVILTKDGFDNGNTVIGGEYFRFDLIAPLAQSTENITLPDGDYVFDPSLSYELFTIIDINNTDYTWIEGDGSALGYAFDNASLTVRGNKIELVALANNTEYHVSFEGDYTLTPPYEITDYVSSLKSDTVIDVSNCTASYNSYGDYWECGFNNWCIEFVCNDGMTQGTYLVLDLISSSTTTIAGTYVASGFTVEDPTKPDFRAGVFVPGFRVSDTSDLLLGSLFMVYKDGLCLSQAPLYDGSVTVTELGNGYYTIVVDALDDAPVQNKITLNWTGYLN